MMVGFDRLVNMDSILDLRKELFQLMPDKDKIEAEIRQFHQVLSSNNIGMHEPLVDNEGFPRNDIDVYQVRVARHKIICLQNDLKALMTVIEEKLHKLHALQAPSLSQDEPMDVSLPEPFACVTFVSPGSPASLCGLQKDDEILEFGSVNKENFKSIQDVAVVVRHSAEQKVPVVVKRKGRHSALSLELVPRIWSGQGLLGCTINPIPVENVER